MEVPKNPNNLVVLPYKLACQLLIFRWLFSLLVRIDATTLEVKGALAGLRQFLAIGSPLKMIKNTFYFILKALFVLRIFKFLS